MDNGTQRGQLFIAATLLPVKLGIALLSTQPGQGSNASFNGKETSR